MPRRSAGSDDELHRLFPEGVAPRAALVQLGMSHAYISRRCRPGGPWQRMMPGVVQLSNGAPTRKQLAQGALAHAGQGAMITGIEAARLHGLKKLPVDRRIHLLIPHSRRVATREFATVERTIYLPEPELIQDLPVAPLPRALIDAAHRMEVLQEVRAMIYEAVERQLCTPGELHLEIEQGTTIGSALPRRVVHEMDRGVHDAATAWARPFPQRARVPEPEWNVELRTERGELLGVADAYWPEAGLAWTLETSAWSLAPDREARIAEQHRRMTAAGILVLRCSPSRLKTDPLGVIRDLQEGHQRAAGRPRPQVRIRARPRAA